jgi:hypothetical protein
MRRQSYIGRIEVTPSEQAYIVLENVLTFSRDKLLLLAQSGSHNLNPYHNTLHELQNLYYSWACYVNQSAGDRSGPGVQDLVQAALFHDHNHSGGFFSDDRKNIARAVEFAERELSLKSPVLRIIECTQFVDGKFPIEPTNLAERCIRDADLMTIYSQEGFRLTLGLFEEMSGKPISKFTEGELMSAIKRTEEFLMAQTMYTDHGNRMRDEHLVRQLRKFGDYAGRQWKYETDFRGRGPQDD